MPRDTHTPASASAPISLSDLCVACRGVGSTPSWPVCFNCGGEGIEPPLPTISFEEMAIREDNERHPQGRPLCTWNIDTRGD